MFSNRLMIKYSSLFDIYWPYLFTNLLRYDNNLKLVLLFLTDYSIVFISFNQHNNCFNKIR